MEILDHQATAVAEITARALAFFRGDWRGLPIQPRWHTLIVGPTGTGKTTVAAMAADTLTRTMPGLITVTMLRASAPNWMPCGAHNRGTRETIGVIAKFVATHDRTMLVIDEIDKLIDKSGDTTWKAYIRNELFDLLDGRWPTGLTPPDNDDDVPIMPIEALTKKLRETVFIVGIGTFQEWYDSAGTRRTMGFGAEKTAETVEISADIVAEKMPRELANRFNADIIRLPELTAADYHRIASQAENTLPERMRQEFRAEVDRRIAGAIAAKKGVRFLEDALVDVLKNPPEFLNSTIPEKKEEKENWPLCI